MAIYELREKMVTDRQRPRYHFVPPEGRWNDLNGMIYWNGRYHVGYLQKIRNGPNERDFSSQQHISSRDLLHWKYHTASLREPLPGMKGDYFNSGGIIHGADVPTIITNMPRRGICVYQCFDDELDHWVPLPENPVIPLDSETSKTTSLFPESVIFDPSGWREGDTYYALIGNKNFRPGYEGDSTSLFASKNLREWEYIGPFYKSERRWTEEVEDCACSDFFPFGDKHMLLMHTHKPYAKCQYYIGRYEDRKFIPERNGQLSRLSAMVFGPESLLDDRGRRIFLATIRDARDWEETGWTNIFTLPWQFSPGPDNGLKIDPAEELTRLRYGGVGVDDFRARAGDELTIDELASNCMEAKMTLIQEGATVFGIKLLCSPDGREETTVIYNSRAREFIVDFDKSSTDTTLRYPQNIRRQIIPYDSGGNPLCLDIFVDRSVIEIFVNSDVVLVQRVYPLLRDSTLMKVFAQDGALRVINIELWEMDASNPW